MRHSSLHMRWCMARLMRRDHEALLPAQPTVQGGYERGCNLLQAPATLQAHTPGVPASPCLGRRAGLSRIEPWQEVCEPEWCGASWSCSYTRRPS